jgi:hypothetical protein
MLKAESVSEYIERLSALPPKERLEAFRAIQDPETRRLIIDGLPPKVHSEMLGEELVQNLNRNAREFWRRYKPDQAA